MLVHFAQNKKLDEDLSGLRSQILLIKVAHNAVREILKPPLSLSLMKSTL